VVRELKDFGDLLLEDIRIKTSFARKPSRPASAA
jgi:hypothetical protein